LFDEDGLLGRELKLYSNPAKPNPRGNFTSKQPISACKPNTKVFKPKRKKLLVYSGVGQKPDQKGKATITGGSAHSLDLLDADQPDDPGASSSTGGSHAMLRPPVGSLPVSGPLGLPGSPSAVGLFFGG